MFLLDTLFLGRPAEDYMFSHASPVTSLNLYQIMYNMCELKKIFIMNLFTLQEGSIVQIAISSDEKTIAFATSKGLVVLLEQCFTDNDYNYQQFAEHEGNIITVLKWENSEVYCGDNTGKVSVITIANLLVSFNNFIMIFKCLNIL